jgi:NAD(P)-dependent dehydrogenase (short-subunit alcohol dehydrogenase family)
MSMRDLEGRTVVVTGASKGIGAATVTAMLAAGARVVAHYGSDRAGAEAAVAGGEPGRVHLVGADFARAEEVDVFWDAAVTAAEGRVDVLVNNAAVMRQSGGIADPVEEWDQVWDEALAVNTLAPARLLRHAVRHWLARGEPGVVIGIGSWVTTRGTSNPGAIAYAASKAAIVAATKTVARNHAAQGILAYVIAPGVVRTRMSVESAAQMGGEAGVTATLPMGEWVLTGATIDVNGAAYIR